MKTKPIAKPNGWEEEFDENFAMYPDFDGKFVKRAVYCEDVKTFIRQAILSAEEAVVREAKEIVKVGIQHGILHIPNPYGDMVRIKRHNQVMVECKDIINDMLDDLLSLPDQDQLSNSKTDE